MKGNTCNVQSIEGIGSDEYIDSHLTCLLEKIFIGKEKLDVNQPRAILFAHDTYLMLLCQHTVLTIKTDQQLLVLQHSPVQTSCKNQLLGLDSARPRKKRR